MSATDAVTQPQIAGASGDSMVTQRALAGAVSALASDEDDLGVGSSRADRGSGTVDRQPSPPSTIVVNHGLAHDSVTGACFAATYTAGSQLSRLSQMGAFVARLSANGRVIESATLFSAAGLSVWRQA